MRFVRTLSTGTLSALALMTLTQLAVAPLAHAGGTKTHEVEGFDDLSDGEVEGAAIETSGRVTRGLSAEHVTLEHSSAFTCLVDGKQAWVGTADKATIQKVDLRGGKPAVEQLVELEGVVVSAMARLPGGDLIAAVLPGGKLLRVHDQGGAKGKVSDFAELAGVEQIWAIVPHKGRLLVGTGPKGELWSVSTDGKDAKIVLDVEDKDILAVLPIGDEILVGVSPKARLYKLDTELAGVMLHEFKGNELRALTLSGDTLVAAVNSFEDRSISSRVALTKQLNRSSLTGEKPEDNDTGRARADADAELWAVDLGQKHDVQRAQDAAWDKWFSKKSQYFIDLIAIDDSGTVLAASSEGGRIYRARGRRDVSVVADLEQRQTTSMCRLDDGGVLATASDGAAVVALSQAPAKASDKTKVRWVSEVLDADHPARYGNFALRGDGKLELRVRTGPTQEADDRWSAWTSVKLAREGLELRGSADLPRRRYLQVEVTLADADAEFRSLVVFYSPENLPPLVESITVKGPNVSTSSDEEPDAEVEIEWDVEARDADDLLYDAFIRGQGSGDRWVKLNTSGPLSKKQIKLDMQTLPDGIYEVRVVASDEPSNGAGAAASDELISEPFVIDRTRPTLEGVKLDGGRITGVAKDRGGYVLDVAFSIDGGSFRAASASDGLFDSSSEKFELLLPGDIGPGRHRVVVRARDANGNLETSALEVGG